MIEIEVFGKKDTRSGFGEGLAELGKTNKDSNDNKCIPGNMVERHELKFGNEKLHVQVRL